MIDEDFNQKIDDGERAARVFALNMNLLTGMDIIAARDVGSWKVEGCDYIINILQQDKPRPGSLKGNTSRGKSAICYPILVHGSAEVKGICKGGLIHRNDVPCLSVPFAVWNGQKRTNYGYKATRTGHGSLKRFFNPNAETLSAEPIALSYIAEDVDCKMKKRPFAAITFTDFPELKRRLIKYAADNEMDLLDWKSIPVDKDAWKYQRGELVFTGNMWMVPLDRLVDIARIIIIGDPPRFFRNGTCTVEMQEQRYQGLKSQATLVLPQEAIRTEGSVQTLVNQHQLYQLMVNGVAHELKGKLVDAYGNKF